MKVIFMGTPDFAQPSLIEICKSTYEVIAAFTQPDRPCGRGHKKIPPIIKVCAQGKNIPVYQPTTLRDKEIIASINEMQPDVIVVVAYGQILPKEVLNIPKYGCVNLHASLLPKYRGAAPIQWAILNGDKETGVMTMKMDVGLDTGDIIMETRMPIGENETSETLFERLSIEGGKLLVKTLNALEAGTATFTPQSDEGISYAGKITKKLSPIDWHKSTSEIHNQIRGLYSWPMAETYFKDMRIRVHESRLTNIETQRVPGEVLAVDDGILVAAGDNKAIRLTRVQAEGRKCLDAQDFLCGHSILPGEHFTSKPKE